MMFESTIDMFQAQRKKAEPFLTLPFVFEKL